VAKHRVSTQRILVKKLFLTLLLPILICINSKPVCVMGVMGAFIAQVVYTFFGGVATGSVATGTGFWMASHTDSDRLDKMLISQSSSLIEEVDKRLSVSPAKIYKTKDKNYLRKFLGIIDKLIKDLSVQESSVDNRLEKDFKYNFSKYIFIDLKEALTEKINELNKLKTKITKNKY
jgi:hypothetical protein